MTLTYADILAELNVGSRVALIIRHAERPHIDRNDPTFGETLALTPAGEADAFALGTLLKPFAHDVAFHSSPMNRTRETARQIAHGMGISPATIEEWEELGNSSFYFTCQRELFEAFKGHDIYPMMEAYLHGKPLAGMGDLHAASDRLEAWIDRHHTRRLTIFATHDLYNAAFLTARNAAEFTATRWIGFLDSAAVIDRPDGTRHYAYIRAQAKPRTSRIV